MKGNVEISGLDLSIIYDALLKLAGDEGCTVQETLISISPEEGGRIYDEVFSVENMSALPYD